MTCRAHLLLALVLCVACTERKGSVVKDRALQKFARLQQLEVSTREARAADSAFFKAHGWFAPTTHERDAGEVLNPLTPWTGTKTSTITALTLTPRVLAALDRKDWSTANVPELDAERDYRWLTALAKYDHWDLSKAPQLSSEGPYHPDSSPIPNLVNVVSWVKLRIRKAKRDGDVEVARAEIHQLARILASTELFINVMIAGAVFDLERYLDPSPGEREAHRVGRLLMALKASTAPFADPKVVADFFAHLDEPLACAAAREALWHHYIYRPLLEPQYPDAYRALGTVIADRRQCQWSYLREAWEVRNTTGRFVDPFAKVRTDQRVFLQARKELSAVLPGVDWGNDPDDLALAILGETFDGAYQGYEPKAP
jgi:hypothetical protein